MHVLKILEQRMWATELVCEESTITRQLGWSAQPVWGRELSMRWLLNRRRFHQDSSFKYRNNRGLPPGGGDLLCC